MPYHVIPSVNALCAFDYVPDLRRCGECGLAVDPDLDKIDLFAKPEGSPPLSETQDGRLLASPTFVRRYHVEGWSGLVFRPLSNGYFVTWAARRVRLVRRELFPDNRADPGFVAPNPSAETGYVIHHSAICDTCGRYRESLGHGPSIIARGEIPLGATEFVASDIELGAGDAKGPFLLAGDDMRATHLARRIRNVSVSVPVSYQSWASDRAEVPAECNVIPLARHRRQ